ncbi:hypothetical protein HN011_007014 [Eciton burchellii]|nr:hypothetical protein HN011_007014 [Eciton burchellii]
MPRSSSGPSWTEHQGVTEDGISFAPIHSNHDYNFLVARRRRISSDFSASVFRGQRASSSLRKVPLGFNRIVSLSEMKLDENGGLTDSREFLFLERKESRWKRANVTSRKLIRNPARESRNRNEATGIHLGAAKPDLHSVLSKDP